MRRVSGFACSITRNWTRPVFFLKADVANFFNTIDREILVSLIECRVHEPWLRSLIRQVALHDPRPGAIMRSPPVLFARVPRHKSLPHAPEGKGLPIGNLTSQFFAHLYLNELDQYVKHSLKARHYGRSVDDMVLFHENPVVLNAWYMQMDQFLKSTLGLHLHSGKKYLNRADTGIVFTGFIIKPGRTYLRQRSLSACKRKVRGWERKGSPVDPETLEQLLQSINSYLGMLRHVNGYKARKSLCQRVESLFLLADDDCTKTTPSS